jgi:hypothetical protein
MLMTTYQTTLHNNPNDQHIMNYTAMANTDLGTPEAVISAGDLPIFTRLTTKFFIIKSEVIISTISMALQVSTTWSIPFIGLCILVMGITERGE